MRKVVSVTEHITYRHTAPVTTHRLSAGTLTLDSSCPALESCGVGYTIRIPRAVAVRISDGAGSIRLESLAGKITAHTNAGNVSLDSVSGPIEVSGAAGSVYGQRVASPRATIRTSAGGIDVSFSAVPAAVTATTAAGSVTLHVPGSVPYAVHATATVGSTHVSVARSPASAHIIRASTRAGSATVARAL